MVRSTFGGFNTARLAMMASQQAMDVTGQNIANINTEGYTRQRLDQVSLNMYGADRYAAINTARIGHGVLVTGVSQIRDPYLDKRFRTEMAKVGGEDDKLAVLNDIKSIFDEVGKDGGIEVQMNDLISKLQDLQKNTGSKEADNIVKGSADVLAKLFNTYATQLEGVREDYEDNLQNAVIPDINGILKDIKELNKTIKNNQVHGNQSLELLDQRNMLIDNLSKYMNIEVKYNPVPVSNSITIDEMSINMINPDGSRTTLVNDDEVTDFAVSKNAEGKWEASFADLNSNAVPPDRITINGDDLANGSLKASLDMLNCNGSFDVDPNATKGIGYYEKMFDLLANKFAQIMNDANDFTEADGVTITKRPLFETNDGGTTITAKNIKISENWANGTYGITASKVPNAPSGDNSNILHIISQLKEKTNFTTTVNVNGVNETRTIFKGNCQEMYTNITTILGLDIQTTNEILDNYVSVASDIDESRMSLSGVSLDEEGMNLLKYNKSFTAAARLATALDEQLDVLINKMGVVGR